MLEGGTDPLFIALCLPDRARVELSELCAGLRLPARGISARFVDPENYHVTLRFLGSVAPSIIDEVASRIRTTGTERAAPACGYLGCAGLPRRSRAHVFVATLKDVTGALGVLYQSLSDALAELGFPGEQRPFHPHVTLARFKKVTDVRALVGATRVPREAWTPSRLVLYRSERRRRGVRYVSLFEQPLAQPPA
jgi:2'-5' RNA ligase